jgi:hypothetical protein
MFIRQKDITILLPSSSLNPFESLRHLGLLLYPSHDWAFSKQILVSTSQKHPEYEYLDVIIIKKC